MGAPRRSRRSGRHLPETTLRRECAEELGIEVSVGDLIDTWVYEPLPGHRVRIATYWCTSPDPPAALRISDEHTAVLVAPLPLADDLTLPDGYRRSIEQPMTLRHDPPRRDTGARST